MGQTIPLTVRFVKLSPLAKVPAHAISGSAGVDLVSVEKADIEPGQRCLVGTGLAVELPRDHALLVCPRSGVALRHGVTVLNAPGVVDEDYRGEVKVMLVNHGYHTHAIRPGDRIAQALLVPVMRTDWLETEKLSGTVRGAGGFGHTGL